MTILLFFRKWGQWDTTQEDNLDRRGWLDLTLPEVLNHKFFPTWLLDNFCIFHTPKEKRTELEFYVR
jgi:hypothetical protein